MYEATPQGLVTFIIVLSTITFILLTTLNDEFNYYKCPENYQLMFVGEHRYEIFTHKCIDLSNNDIVDVSITNDEDYENAKYLNKVGVYFGRIFFGAVLLMSLLISCLEVFSGIRMMYHQYTQVL